MLWLEEPVYKDGFRWMKTLLAHGFGGILADDMGLGKTLQVISVLLSERAEQQASLRAGFSVSVVSADRPGALIPRIFSTSDYLLSPYGALVYGGLMDYRALTGEGAPALLLAEESPLRWGEEVLTALGKPAENIVGQIDGLEREAALRRRGD